MLSPNIAFVGEKPWKPLVEVQTAFGSFQLPKDQEKPFYHEQVTYLVNQFPHLYKRVISKGVK